MEAISSLPKEIKYPLPMGCGNSKVFFTFRPPSSIKVVGSWLIKTCFRKNYDVNLSLEMPQVCTVYPCVFSVYTCLYWYLYVCVYVCTVKLYIYPMACVTVCVCEALFVYCLLMCVHMFVFVFLSADAFHRNQYMSVCIELLSTCRQFPMFVQTISGKPSK